MFILFIIHGEENEQELICDRGETKREKKSLEFKNETGRIGIDFNLEERKKKWAKWVLIT